MPSFRPRIVQVESQLAGLHWYRDFCQRLLGLVKQAAGATGVEQADIKVLLADVSQALQTGLVPVPREHGRDFEQFLNHLSRKIKPLLAGRDALATELSRLCKEDALRHWELL